MNNVLKELREELNLRKEIDRLRSKQNGTTSNSTKPPRKPMSQATINKIKRAQKRRWKNIKANQK